MRDRNGIFQKKPEDNHCNHCNYFYCMDDWINDTSCVNKLTMIKLRKQIIISFLLLTMSILFLAPPVSCATANITQRQKQTREKINHLKHLENVEKNKLYKNQKKLENASNNLAVLNTQYSNVQSQLSKLEQDVVISQNECNQLDQQMKIRVRKVFKKQRTGMFELILSARDFNSLLDTVYFERLILKQDYRNIQFAKAKAVKLSKMQRDIEAKRKYLARSKRDINYQQKDLQKAIAKNQSMINKLNTDRRYYERTERELARQSENLQNMISRKSKDNSFRVSSTGFVKPIGGRITSPFGWRTHPIFKSRTFHSGVDIGGPNYGSIVASNSGRVIYAGWYGGYGKVVIVDHGTVNGKPMTTLYAHMSTIKVNSGDYVKKGQALGLEGTTGYSTGPHCHFEVRINGKPNNPMNYI